MPFAVNISYKIVFTPVIIPYMKWTLPEGLNACYLEDEHNVQTLDSSHRYKYTMYTVQALDSSHRYTYTVYTVCRT